MWREETNKLLYLLVVITSALSVQKRRGFSASCPPRGVHAKRRHSTHLDSRKEKKERQMAIRRHRKGRVLVCTYTRRPAMATERKPFM